MSVADHKPPTIDPIVESLLGFEPQTGKPSGHMVEILRQLRDHLLGSARIIPCDASGTANAIILTPNNPISPIMESYTEHDAFAFVAAANSTSTVTVTVVPRDGTLATIKLYKTAGSAQANNGDLVAGLFYVAYYVSSMDSGNGVLVLK